MADASNTRTVDAEKTVEAEKTGDAFVENVDQAARIANQDEHDVGAIKAIKMYPWALAWCCYAVWMIILNSFENQAGGSVLGIPQFRKDFGYKFGDTYVLHVQWQSAFSGAPVASACIASLGIGYIADKIGRKWAYALGLVFSYIGITIEFVATTNPMFFAGKFVNGFAIGTFVTLSFTYIGEISPTALRGIVSSGAAIAFTLGPFLVALIIKGTGSYTTRWAYRAVFLAQYGVAAIGTIFLPFMPESPWWLLGKGNEAKAAHALRKLGYTPDGIEKRMAAMVLTLQEVQKTTSDASYLECFRKSNLRRTGIAIAPYCIQTLSGIYFASNYSTYYYQLAGYSSSESFVLQIIQQVISMIGNIMSWFLVERVGRRPLMFYGLCFLTVDLILTGALAVVATPAALKGTCALILIYCWAYNVTIGAIAYTLLAETATSRLRIKTVAIGIFAHNAINVMWAFVIPKLFNPDQANLGAKVSFIFGGLAALACLYLWIYQPETAGRTYKELDELFTNKVAGRKFKSTKTQTELEGMQAKDIQSEKTKGGQTVEQ
ncbi:general substrate transporter [Hyaloscypha variabilis F]|uniref:General substrate transporter n=1 Tax=Hyaloscypha variabilis (strain UAMH 11265 / GT02V1 / F) TaxID=1149755 RepID=A0A2J6RD99_HYAVF|nr:general substrate transporter [Hyaloscypha variabilis F]